MGTKTNSRLLGLPKRWLIGATVLLALVSWVIPGMVGGWVTWTGMDPVVDVGNHRLSVYVEWPDQYTCTISGVEVAVVVPKGTKATLVSESSGDFGCKVLSTTTSLSSSKDLSKTANVTTLLRSAPSFPIRVRLSLDGRLVATVEGNSNAPASASVSIG